VNDPYNAADLRALRRATRAAKHAEAERRVVIFNLMASPGGRNWVHSILADCAIFSTTFTGEALSGAFNEGKRSVGLQLLTDVVRWAPDQYIQMMREQTDKEQANARRDDSGHSGSDANGGGSDLGRPDDAGGSVTFEYDPGDDGVGEDTTH
jgi:hypothetical protein